MDSLRWSSLLAHWSAGRGPMYVRLGAALQGCISGGHLAPGEQLPSERRLAELIQVSRSTVVAAYEELAAGGWISRRQGSGTHVGVAAPRLAEVLALRSPVRGSPVSGSPVRPALQSEGEFDLTIAVPGLGPVQQERLKRASASQGVKAFSESLYHPLGLPDLRATLAEMYARQGLPTRAEQIVVTTGAQQAISVIAGAVLRRGDAVLLETPTYFGAIDVFRAAGARLLGGAVGPDGMQPTAFQAQLGAGPRLAFLTPTFQNPTGGVMPAHARARLARMIAGAQLPTIEDDTPIDLGFGEDSPPPRLAALEPRAPIVCVGSLSKLFWAGLRVGWMRLPDALAAPIIQSKTLADFGSAMPSQLIALELLRELPILRAERRASVLPARDLLVTLLREHLPDWTYQVPAGGQFLWAQLPTRNAAGFTHLARRYGVRLFPGASMDVTDLPDSFLRLPFTLPVQYLPEAVARLKLAWISFQERGTAERLA